ncbi:MAG: cytochrome b N-terminal domain-containing protein [Actinobacteria bacterium]|nr:cytochrome b N-terminal domain-containing protein [Actinomycetota bacterium]
MLSKVVRTIARPFDERFNLTNRLHESLLDKPVPDHARRYYFCFGGIAFFLFLTQAITGVLLTMYYVPSQDQAYSSVFYISNYVNYGWLLRSIHNWGAQLMVVFVMLHMLRVYITASYKHPREFNWVVGMLLLMTTMAFTLTGYLLPWDQKAYWGSTVTISLVEKVPFFGKSMANIIMGGDKLGQATLTRFFSAHIMVLPAGLVLFMAAHFWMVRKQGISGPL